MAGNRGSLGGGTGVGLLSVQALALVQKSKAFLVMVMVLLGASGQAFGAWSVGMSIGQGQQVSFSVTADSVAGGNGTVFYKNLSWHGATDTGWSQVGTVSTVGTQVFANVMSLPDPSWDASNNEFQRFGVEVMVGGVTVAQRFWTYNGTGGAVETDSTFTPLPQYSTYSNDGGSAKVYATRSGATGTIHVKDVALPTGAKAWSIGWGFATSTGGAGMMFTTGEMPPSSNDHTKDFNLTGLPEGTSEQVWVQFTASDSSAHTIFRGNVQFPADASNTTPPIPVQDSTQSTYTNGQGTQNNPPSTQPISQGTGGGGSSGGGGSGGTGGGSGGTGSGPTFWSTTQPSTPADPTDEGTQSSGGDQFDLRIASIKDKLKALGFDFAPLMPGSVVDMPTTVNAGDIGGTPIGFTMRFMPDPSTDMGRQLVNGITTLRAVIACLVVYGMFQACINLAKELL